MSTRSEHLENCIIELIHCVNVLFCSMLSKWEELTDLQLTLQHWMSSARGAVCDDIMDIAIAKEQQVRVA